VLICSWPTPRNPKRPPPYPQGTPKAHPRQAQVPTPQNPKGPTAHPQGTPKAHPRHIQVPTPPQKAAWDLIGAF